MSPALPQFPASGVGFSVSSFRRALLRRQPTGSRVPLSRRVNQIGWAPLRLRVAFIRNSRCGNECRGTCIINTRDVIQHPQRFFKSLAVNRVLSTEHIEASPSASCACAFCPSTRSIRFHAHASTPPALRWRRAHAASVSITHPGVGSGTTQSPGDNNYFFSLVVHQQ